MIGKNYTMPVVVPVYGEMDYTVAFAQLLNLRKDASLARDKVTSKYRGFYVG